MGLFESVERSQRNIDQLAGTVQDYFAKKREKEQKEKLRSMLTRQEAEVPTDVMQAAAAVEQMGPREATGQRGTAPGVMGSRMVQQTPATMRERVRSIDDLDGSEVFQLADLLGLSPKKTVGLAGDVARSRRPKREVKEVEGKLFGVEIGPEGFKTEDLGGPGKAGGRDYTAVERETARHNKEMERLRGEEVRRTGAKDTVAGTEKDAERQEQLRKERKGLVDQANEIELELGALKSGIYKGAQVDANNPDQAELVETSRAALTKQLKEKYDRVMELDAQLKTQPAAPARTTQPAPGRTIQVRLKSDVGGNKAGTVGEIDESEFDPELMEEVQ